MNKRLIEALMSEIENQCEMVKIATEGINHFHNEDGVSIHYLWFNVQGLLIATANISKVFWNKERMVKPPEVSYLQELLEIRDSSKINSRRFRNFFEHYDRHLIEWGKSGRNRSLAMSNVMPKGSLMGIDPRDTFKTYYNDINVIAFKGKELELQPVIKEVARILDAIKRIDDVYYSFLNSPKSSGVYQ